MNERRVRVFLTLVLLASAALFAIGVAIERHDERSEPTAHAVKLDGLLLADADSETETSAAAGESSKKGGGSGETHSETGESKTGESSSEGGAAGETPAQRQAEGHPETPAEHRAERANERVFGVDLESTPVVVAAVAVSLLLAVALWLTPHPLVPLAIVGFALVAAVFDVREVFHQIDVSRGGLAAIAGVVAALHLAAAALALLLIRTAGTLVRRPAT